MYRKDFSSLGQTPMLFRYDSPDFMMGEKILRAVVSGDWTFGNFSTNTVLKYFRYRMDDNSQRGVCYSPLVQYLYGAGDDAGFEENISYQPTKNLSFTAGVSYTYSGVLPTTNESPYKFPKKKYRPDFWTVWYLPLRILHQRRICSGSLGLEDDFGYRRCALRLQFDLG